MKKIIIAALLAAASLTAVVGDADARRLGGGSSIGRQSGTLPRPAPASPYNNSQARPATPQSPAQPMPARPSPWRGIVGGLLGGALLGAMFSSLGFGGAMSGMLGSLLTVVLLAALVMFILRLLRGNTASNQAGPAYQQQIDQPYQPGYQPSYPSSYTDSVRVPEIGSRLEPSQLSGPTTPLTLPAGFDTAAFLRNAKSYFIRLQAAWDRADIGDLREFTTPEMYAELKLQIQERGPAANVTDVVSIEAELLGMETAGSDYLASVRFFGTISENPGAQAEAFQEVWNLSKPLAGPGGWVLAGVQQIQ